MNKIRVWFIIGLFSALLLKLSLIDYRIKFIICLIKIISDNILLYSGTNKPAEYIINSLKLINILNVIFTKNLHKLTLVILMILISL